MSSGSAASHYSENYPHFSDTAEALRDIENAPIPSAEVIDMSCAKATELLIHNQWSGGPRTENTPEYTGCKEKYSKLADQARNSDRFDMEACKLRYQNAEEVFKLAHCEWNRDAQAWEDVYKANNVEKFAPCMSRECYALPNPTPEELKSFLK